MPCLRRLTIYDDLVDTWLQHASSVDESLLGHPLQIPNALSLKDHMLVYTHITSKMQWM